MNRFRVVLLISVFLFASGCSLKKPVWPAVKEPKAQNLTDAAKELPPFSELSVYIRSPGQPLLDVANFKQVVSDKEINERETKLLATMALDAHILNLLQGVAVEQEFNILNDTAPIRAKEQVLNKQLKEIKNSSLPQDQVRKRFVGPYLKKSKISQAGMRDGLPRLVVAYGFSEDYQRVGISAKLIYQDTYDAKKRQCFDEFDVTHAIFKGDGSQTKVSSLSELARNYHVARQAFRSASRNITTLLSKHLSSQSIVFDDLSAIGQGRLKFQDYLTFDGRYTADNHAFVLDDGQVYMYRKIVGPERCGARYATIQTESGGLKTMAVELAQLKAQRDSHKLAESNKRFAREQGQRNQQILYKRLGLK